eukprot:2990541-Amphidinium_carterae.1
MSFHTKGETLHAAVCIVLTIDGKTVHAEACESYERCTTGTTGVHCAQCIPGYSIRKFSAVEDCSLHD